MDTVFFTGSYAKIGEKGIACLFADPETGRIRELFSDTQAYCPSYVLVHPRLNVLYAVRELTEEGALVTFLIRENSLEKVGEMPTDGADPCHISMDEDCRLLSVTNYSGGSISIFRLDEKGIPSEMTEHVEHEGSGPVNSRQESAHPHFSRFSSGKLYVCDLGADKIFIYDVDPGRGKLSRFGEILLPAGAGPRHLLFPKGHDDLLYAVGELSSSLYVFRKNENIWKLTRTVSALPQGCSVQNLSAAIKQSADGKALFVTNRGHDSIAVFGISEEGFPDIKGFCGSGGKTPRDIFVLDRFLIAADQDSNHLAVLKYEPETFALTDTGIRHECISPTCTAADKE